MNQATEGDGLTTVNDNLLDVAGRAPMPQAETDAMRKELEECRAMVQAMGHTIASVWRCVPPELHERVLRDETITSANKLPWAIAWMQATKQL